MNTAQDNAKKHTHTRLVLLEILEQLRPVYYVDTEKLDVLEDTVY